MERLAIMGGTFDPIHMGHLRMAHAVQRQLEFDKVVFLPAYKSMKTLWSAAWNLTGAACPIPTIP